MDIRPFLTEDAERIKQITVETFTGVAIDFFIEQQFGRLGNGWQERKARSIDDDIRANPDGIFVAVEETGEILGYITTRIDQTSLLGWIPNIGVCTDRKGQGIGMMLMQRALAYLQQAGMTHAKIETLEPNHVGSQFYPQVGFEEVVRQIHYVIRLPGDQETSEHAV